MPSINEYLSHAVHAAQTCASLHTILHLRAAGNEVCLANDMVRMHRDFDNRLSQRGQTQSLHTLGQTLLAQMPGQLKEKETLRDDVLYRFDQAMQSTTQVYLSRFAYHLGDELGKIGNDLCLPLLVERTPKFYSDTNFQKPLSAVICRVGIDEKITGKRADGTKISDYPYLRLEANASPTEGGLTLSWNKMTDGKGPHTEQDSMAYIETKEEIIFTPKQIIEIIDLVQRNTKPLFRKVPAASQTHG